LEEKDFEIEEETSDKLVIFRDCRKSAENIGKKIVVFLIIDLIFIFLIIFIYIWFAIDLIPILGVLAAFLLIGLYAFGRLVVRRYKLQKLIIDCQNQRIMYFSNFLKKSRKGKEYTIENLNTIEVKNYYRSYFEIYFNFSNHKLKIFEDMKKERINQLSKMLLKYLDVSLIGMPPT